MAATSMMLIMTAEDLFQLPDDDYKYELVERGLIRMPPSGGEHGYVASNMSALLRNYVKTHDLGVVCRAETGFILNAILILYVLPTPPLLLKSMFLPRGFREPIGLLPLI